MTLRKTDWFAVYGQLLKRHKGTTFLLLHYFVFCYCYCCSLLLVFFVVVWMFFFFVFCFLKNFFLSLQTSPTTVINVLIEVADSVKGPRGPVPPPLFIFRANWGPKGRKKKIFETAPSSFFSGSGWPGSPLSDPQLNGLTWKCRPTQGTGR